jgi:hypothetical protein
MNVLLCGGLRVHHEFLLAIRVSKALGSSFPFPMQAGIPGCWHAVAQDEQSLIRHAAASGRPKLIFEPVLVDTGHASPAELSDETARDVKDDVGRVLTALASTTLQHAPRSC